MKKKSIYGVLGIIPIAVIPVVALSCESPFKREPKRRLLNSSQLASIRQGIDFSLTKEGRKMNDSQLMDIINDLNKKFNGDGNRIQHEPEFRKYFSAKVPDISKITLSHRIDIRFKVNNITRSVEMRYDVICFDFTGLDEIKDEFVGLERG
ncbi:hypothetical protein [Mycoplasma phocoeninasale]|uniref:Variable surface lipoprotein n=1 Tax=Mycoplasma phocoeninasale TaxID=2726117 RepID=A0A858U0L7_9MOLU|nr:hypothetical protein [Mycoplasma phocoeninasale]MBN0970757.1 hypothetical protein [Mycoplasma phocoeninasale]QJG66614.1 hypothetical protein HGG64_02815 [Mycoplasma phocoeninasale]